VELNITAKYLNARVKAVRASLISEDDTHSFDDDTHPFDLDAAYKLYQMLFGSFASRITSKTRLYVVSNEVLTSLPG
jgi:hypothetical protein